MSCFFLTALNILHYFHSSDDLLDTRKCISPVKIVALTNSKVSVEIVVRPSQTCGEHGCQLVKYMYANVYV